MSGYLMLKRVINKQDRGLNFENVRIGFGENKFLFLLKMIKIFFEIF